MKLNKNLGFTLALLIPSSPLVAEDNDFSPSSSLTISAGTNSDNNKNQQIDLNIELKEFQQISIGFGKSTSNTDSLNTTQKYIGIATDPYKTFSVGAEYSFWGKNSALETRSLKSDLLVNLDEWNFSISPQLNVVTFYGLNGNNKFDLYSEGVSFSANYYGFEKYFLGINYYVNKFADDPFFFNSNFQIYKDFITKWVSESAQQLMSGLEKYHGGASIGRFMDWGSIEINWTKSKSSFDESETYISSVLIDYQLNEQLNLNMIAARQTSPTDNYHLNSIDIGLGIRW